MLTRSQKHLRDGCESISDVRPTKILKRQEAIPILTNSNEVLLYNKRCRLIVSHCESEIVLSSIWFWFPQLKSGTKDRDKVIFLPDFGLNDVVWGKLRGYVAWPAKIINISIKIDTRFNGSMIIERQNFSVDKCSNFIRILRNSQRISIKR